MKNLDFKKIQERAIGVGVGTYAANFVEKYLFDMAKGNDQIKEYKSEIMAALGLLLPELVDMGKNSHLVENAGDALLAKGLEGVMLKNKLIEVIAGTNSDYLLGCGCKEYVAGDESQYYTIRDEKTGGVWYLKDSGGDIPDFEFYVPSYEEKTKMKDAIRKNMQAQQLAQNGEIVRPQDLGMSQMEMPAQFIKTVKETPQVAGNINKKNLI